MKFIKFLKNIFLLLILLLFIAAGVLLQSGLALKNTLFSESYFHKTLDENDMGENIMKFVKDVIDNSEKLIPIDEKKVGVVENGKPTEVTPEAQKLMTSDKKKMKQNIDKNWIKMDIQKTMGMIYGYFLLGNGKLPTINIKPVKEILVNMIEQEAIKDFTSDDSKQTDKMAAEVKDILHKHSKDGRVNDIVVDETMKLEQFKAMNASREAVMRIDSKIAGSDSIKSEELFKYTITEIVKDDMGFYGIKDELDLNLLYEAKYGDKYNPVTGAAVMIGDIKESTFLIIFMMFILLLLIIVVTAYSPKSILRWSGVGMFISGVMGMMFYVLAKLANSSIKSQFKGFNVDAKGLDITFVQNWGLSYMDGVWKGIFICALIFAIMGAAFITVSFFTQHFFKKISKYSGIQRVLRICKEKKTFLISVRTAVVLMMLIAISVNTSFNINRIRASVEQYNEMKEKTKIKAMDTDKALGRVLNAEKYMDIVKSEK